MMFCVRCGTKNDDGSQFCVSCGAPLTQAGAGPAGSVGQGPAGYGYGGAQPDYGTPPNYGMQPNYGPQPNYGAAPIAGAPMGQGQAGYGYPGVQTAYAPPNAAKKKNILPIIAVIAVLAVAAIAVYMIFFRTDPLVGSWMYEIDDGYEQIITFKDNGKGKIMVRYDGDEIDSESFEWEIIDKGELRIKNSYGKKYVYEYTIKGDTLKLTDTDSDATLKLTRVK